MSSIEPDHHNDLMKMGSRWLLKHKEDESLGDLLYDTAGILTASASKKFLEALV